MTQDVLREENSAWKTLYRLGGIAALLAVFVFRRNLSAELMALRVLGVFPLPAMPANVTGWFVLLQSNPLVGLTLLNLFDLVEYTLLGLVFLAICSALWQTDRSAILVATVSGLIGIIAYFSSNQAFAMLALSERYAAAGSDIPRASILAAGEALLAINNPGALHQGTGIYVCMFLVPLAGLIMSLVMLRGTVFNKATAVTGILANGLILCYFPVLAFAPSMLILPFVLSAPFRVTWYFLLALRLFKLAKDVKPI
jgi:hypothetical protein